MRRVFPRGDQSGADEAARAAEPSPQALALHESLIVIDGHCDSAAALVDDPKAQGRDFLARGGGKVDLPRLREGGVTCQFMAMFVDDAYISDARAHTYRLLEAIEALFARTGDFRLALSAADIEAAKAGLWISALLTIEGGEAIGEDLENLRGFYGRGVRLMGLTWNRRNALGRGAGTGNPAVDGGGGLTEFGKKTVAEMERLGIIVDASHLSDEALGDLLELAQRPVVASHSNSRELCPHHRNLTEAQVEGIAATGGLVAATFAGMFIDPDKSKVSLARFLDHIDRLVSVAGEDHVGIGSDFDGFPDDWGLVIPDCSQMARLTSGLMGRGFDALAIAKIMGGNWLRVIGEILGR